MRWRIDCGLVVGLAWAENVNVKFLEGCGLLLVRVVDVKVLWLKARRGDVWNDGRSAEGRRVVPRAPREDMVVRNIV